MLQNMMVVQNVGLWLKTGAPAISGCRSHDIRDRVGYRHVLLGRGRSLTAYHHHTLVKSAKQCSVGLIVSLD